MDMLQTSKTKTPVQSPKGDKNSSMPSPKQNSEEDGIVKVEEMENT